MRLDGSYYPSHLDLAWVAVDRSGRIGVFTTGGAGPIPMVFLREGTALDLVNDLIGTLPARSGFSLTTEVPRPDDFIAFARKGLFAFDWADVHRTRDHAGRYEIQARPTVPAYLGEVRWTEAAAALLKSVSSGVLDFDDPRPDVRAALECGGPATQGSW